MTAIAGPPPKLDPSAPAPPRRPASRPWLAVGAAVAVLVIAGGVRTWQGNLVAGQMASGLVSPFPLKDLPKDFGEGRWQALSDEGLDPIVARNAGSTDSIKRVYVDRKTGVKLIVLVLYGPAMGMHMHAPEVCFPAQGFASVSPGSLRPVGYEEFDKSPGHADFRTLVYTKGEGPSAERRQVTYAWGCLGKWTPDLPPTKAFHRIPGMFKVHIERPCDAHEPVGEDGPSELFLKQLLPEIDARIRGAARVAAR